MSDEVVYTTQTKACGAGYPDCACDLVSPEICDEFGWPRGFIHSFCECHDCYICGEVECDGHEVTA